MTPTRHKLNISIIHDDKFFVTGMIFILKDSLSMKFELNFIDIKHAKYSDLFIVSDELRFLIEDSMISNFAKVIVVQNDKFLHNCMSRIYPILQKCSSLSNATHLVESIFSQNDRVHYAFKNMPFNPLSMREFQVLQYLKRGQSQLETSIKLGLNIKTVSAHKRNAMRKIGLLKNYELYHWLRTHNLHEMYRSNI